MQLSEMFCFVLFDTVFQQLYVYVFCEASNLAKW